MTILLRRFYDEPLAQASYLLACMRTREAIVVDPYRDVALYVEAARADGVRIAHVTETHIHADFVSGARELAHTTGATLCLSDAGPPDWKYAYAAGDGARLLHEGDRIVMGDARIDVLHTPGHTPEHLTFVVTDTRTSEAPVGAFTGDFLFVGEVGRPDLLERAAGVAGSMESAARTLFRSLQRLASLPDHLQIWPGHGAGSACGKSLGALPQSTLGYERIANWALSERDEAAFVRAVLEGQPDPPAYFAVMKRVNRDGPRVLGSTRRPQAVSANELRAALAAGSPVLDVRDAASFARTHVPGSVNVPLGKSFSLWAGSVLPYERPLHVIAPEGGAAAAETAIRQLSLIGYDDVRGYTTWDLLAGSHDARHRMRETPQLDPAAVRKRIARGDQVLDVRNADEWSHGHIEGAVHIPLPRLVQRIGELDPSKPVVVHCQMGGRSAVAASLLESLGFSDVANLAGGFQAWENEARK